MLVLSRKVGERIVIDDNITVVINRVSGNRITLGIDAPKDVRIVRGELADERAKTEEPYEAPPIVPHVASAHPMTLDFCCAPIVNRAR